LAHRRVKNPSHDATGESAGVHGSAGPLVDPVTGTVLDPATPAVVDRVELANAPAPGETVIGEPLPLAPPIAGDQAHSSLVETQEGLAGKVPFRPEATALDDPALHVSGSGADALEAAGIVAREPLGTIETGLGTGSRSQLDRTQPRYVDVAGARPHTPMEMFTSGAVTREHGLDAPAPVQADIHGLLPRSHVGKLVKDAPLPVPEGVTLASARPKIGSIVVVIGHDINGPAPQGRHGQHMTAIVSRVMPLSNETGVPLIDATVFPPGAPSIACEALAFGVQVGNWYWPEWLDAIMELRALDAARVED
jgi:hypothetical protein